MRYLVTCAYNGANYFGWQKQVNVKTVQEKIETVLSRFFNENIIIHASGRTDAKVHALGQAFHFDAVKSDKPKLLYSLNKMLPNDIKLLTIKTVKDSFHARYSAKQKTYRYDILLIDKDPFNRELILFYPYLFDIKRFEDALSLFVGCHDFKSFTSKPSDEGKFIREIFSITVKQKGQKISTTFVGSGFMQGQIRMMIATCLAVASGKIETDYIKLRLNNEVRNTTCYKVDGQGLYLVKVKY